MGKNHELMDIEEMERVIEEYCINNFNWPLNKQGEPMAIPPGQTVPHGYAKFRKIARKAFIAGMVYQRVNCYGRTEMDSYAEFCAEQRLENPDISYYELWEKWKIKLQQ